MFLSQINNNDDDNNKYRGKEEIFEGEDIFIASIVVMVSRVPTYLQTCQIAHINYAQLPLYQLYLNKVILKEK